MKKNHARAIGQIMLVFFCFYSLVVLSSCASTRLTATWYDTSYQDRDIMENSLVVAIVKNEMTRRMYEDAFVKKLAENNIHAIASYTLSQPDIKPEEAAVREAVNEAGARSVLITRHLSTDTKQHYRPPERTRVYADPYYSRMSRYYPMSYREVYSPGYTVNVTTVYVESNLYNADTAELVWSAQSESIDPKLTPKYIDELVQTFYEDLKKKGLL